MPLFSLIISTPAKEDYNFIQHVDTLNGYTISYPENWVEEIWFGKVLFTSEPDNGTVPILTTVDVEIDTLASGLDEYFQTYSLSLADHALFKNTKIVYVKKKRIQKFSGIQIEVQADFFNYRLMWRRIFIEKQKKIYSITTTSNADRYYLHHSLTKRMFNSFKFIKN